MSRPLVVAFDMIGTVFSLDALRPPLDRLGLPALALDWLYTATLRDSFALACSNGYQPFKSVMGGALDELLALNRIEASGQDREAVTEALADLRAHPDANEAFRILKAAGVSVVALSNGAASATRHLLESNGLDALVDDVLSVESVKLSKPRPEVYLYAARARGVEPGAVMLVATHPWDVHGALMAGLQGGYVSRGRPYPACFSSPDVSGHDLADVAHSIVG